MPFEYDVTTDLRFIQGKEVGFKKGLELARKENIKRGIEESKIEAIVKGYQNDISISILATITSFSEEKVIQILKKNNLM